LGKEEKKMGAFVKKIRILKTLAVASSCALLISCASVSHVGLSELGAPGYHVSTGIRLLDQKKFADAGREFEIALKMSPGYANAFAGLGLVSACKRDFRGGVAFLTQAEHAIRSDEENAFVAIATIRFNTLRHIFCQRAAEKFCDEDESQWLKKSEEAFKRVAGALKKLRFPDNRASAAYYFMAVAYLQGFEIAKAADMFQMVIDLRGNYLEEAENQLQLVGKIKEAKPQTAIAKRIACAEDINRAEVVALFCEELKIKDLIYRKTSGGIEKTSKAPVPRDIGNCRFRSMIEEINAIGIKGLHVYPDGSFRPGDLVNRSDFAVMIEDIVAKVLEKKAAKHKRRHSPFYDVSSEWPFFDAVIFATSRGFMEPVGALSSSFSPFQQLSGIDAVFAVRKMKDIFHTNPHAGRRYNGG
jgi:hypothetical protein